MSERIKKSLGAVQVAAAVFVALAGILAATIAGLPTTAKVKKPDPVPPVAIHYLDVLGLSPDALAAAGLGAEQAAQIKANLQAHFEGNGVALQAAIDAWGSAYRDEDMARRAVQSSKGTVENLAARQTSLANAAATKQSAISTATTAALDGFDNAIVEKLARIKANRPQNVPVQYLLTDRTEEQWRQLRDALSHKRTRKAAGRQIDSDAAAVIAEADAQSGTAAAATGVSNNLEAIRQTME